jgi:hypothetical protein
LISPLHFNKEFNPTLKKRVMNADGSGQAGEEGEEEEFFGQRKDQKGKNGKDGSQGYINTVPVVVDMLYQDNTTSTLYNQYLMYGNSYNNHGSGAGLGSENTDKNQNRPTGQNFEDMYRYLFDSNNTGKLIITPYTITNIAYNIFRQLVKTTNLMGKYTEAENAITTAISHFGTPSDLKRLGIKPIVSKIDENGDVISTSTKTEAGETIIHLDGIEFDPDDVSNGQEYLRRLGEMDIATIVMEQFYQNIENNGMKDEGKEVIADDNNNSDNNNAITKSQTAVTTTATTHRPPLQPTLYSWWQPSGDQSSSFKPQQSSSSHFSFDPTSDGQTRHGSRLYLFESTTAPVPKQHFNGSAAEPNAVQVVDYLWKPPNVNEWMVNSYKFEQQLQKNEDQRRQMQTIKHEATQKVKHGNNQIGNNNEVIQNYKDQRQPTNVFAREKAQKAVDEQRGNEFDQIAAEINAKIAQQQQEQQQQAPQTDTTPQYLKIKTAGMVGTVIGHAAAIAPAPVTGSTQSTAGDAKQTNKKNGNGTKSYKEHAAAVVASADAAPAPPPRAGAVGFGQYSNYYKNNSAFSSGPPPQQDSKTKHNNKYASAPAARH